MNGQIASRRRVACRGGGNQWYASWKVAVGLASTLVWGEVVARSPPCQLTLSRRLLRTLGRDAVQFGGLAGSFAGAAAAADPHSPSDLLAEREPAYCRVVVIIELKRAWETNA